MMPQRLASSARAAAAVLVGLVLLAPQLSAQTTWYVDINGTPPGSGTQGDPYTSIQYAIRAADDGTG